MKRCSSVERGSGKGGGDSTVDGAGVVMNKVITNSGNSESSQNGKVLSNGEHSESVVFRSRLGTLMFMQLISSLGVKKCAPSRLQDSLGGVAIILDLVPYSGGVVSCLFIFLKKGVCVKMPG